MAGFAFPVAVVRGRAAELLPGMTGWRPGLELVASSLSPIPLLH